MFLSKASSTPVEIPSPVSRLTAPVFSSIIVTVISLTVILGWMFDIDFLKRIIPGYVMMNPMTAVAFIFSCIALWLLQKDGVQEIRVGRLCAAAVVLVGVIKLCAIFKLFDIGIDQLFYTREAIDNVTGQPNRMAPTTALNFLLLGIALLLFRYRTERNFYPAQFPGIAVLLIATVAVVGYLYDAKAFYAIFAFNPMAIHTAVSFMLLAGGMLLSRHAQGIVKELFNPDLSEQAAKELASFKFALDQSSIVAVTDRRGKIIYVNDKFCEISGFARAELYGQNHRIINGDYHSEEFIENLWETISSGEVWHGEIRNRAKSNEFYWAETTIVPFLDGYGKPYQYVAIHNDITARKESEQSLRRSEENYRQLADAMPQMVWVADPTGKVDYFNQRWVEYTGKTVEALLAGGAVLIHPDDEQQYLERWTKARSTGEQYKVEYRFRRASDGEYRWHLGQALPVRDQNEKIVKWFGTCTDIHEQKKVEEELRAIQDDLERRVEVRTDELKRVVFNLTDEIDEHKRTEEKLIGLSSIVESSDDAIVSKNLDGVILSWNKGAENLYGYTDEEITGKSISLLVPPGREDEEPKIMERIRRGESIEHFETVRMRNDGNLLDVSLTISPIRNAAGEITGAAKIARDISERKRIERALEEATKRERAMIENALDVICTVDADGRFTSINPACFRMWGYLPEELIGRQYIDLVALEDVPKTNEIAERIMAGKKVNNFENLYRHKNGTFVNTMWTSHWSESERLMFAVAHDITERKQAEEALEKERIFLDAVLANMTDSLVACDAEGNLTLFNRAAKELHGLPAEPFAAEHWTEHYNLYLADGKTPMSKEQIPLFRAFNGETVSNAEMVIAPKDREPRTLLAGGQSLFDAQGRKIGAVVGMHDITERKKAEEDLRTFAAKLERSNAELQDFASVASHDLQEPLRKVQAFGDRLKSKCGDALNEEGLDYLERMQNAAERMQTLINDLLTFSRVESKAQPFVSVNLRRAATEALKDLEVLIETTNASVEIGEMGMIEADQMQMRQLLQNLIGNALKFHRPGVPPVVKISGRTFSVPHKIVGVELFQLTVADNGIGFDEKYNDRIFKVFQRLHGRNEYEGTGIGLAVCRKIAERHGGRITARSIPGEGSIFMVQLPINHRQNR